MASESIEELANRIKRHIAELFPSGDFSERSDLHLYLQRSEEYRRDRHSVPPEWRQLFEDVREFQRQLWLKHRNRPKRVAYPAIKPKDDEAFRFYLDEPDVKN